MSGTGTAAGLPQPQGDEGSFPRLQERSQTQLGFVNNLLITLAVGLLAFAVDTSASGAELRRLGWRKWLLFTGLVLLGLSVLAGLRLAFNRLTSHRITARVARLRQLRDRCRAGESKYVMRRIGRQAAFFETWARGSLTKQQEKSGVRAAARALASHIPGHDRPARPWRPRQRRQAGQAGPAGPNVSVIASSATDLVEALRNWYERADDWTWIWLRFQAWLFITGAGCLLVVPLSYYFSVPGA